MTYPPHPIPGPASRELARRLAAVECPTVTFLAEDFPVFWSEAHGCTVTDVDGNTYLDLTAAFGVASVGHAHPEVVEALTAQAQKMLHGMGDVHPTALKVALLERLASLCPGELSQSVLGSSGSDAIEVARKACALYTGRPRLLAFEGAYHGLTYGALELTHRDDFRAPFRAQLAGAAVWLPWPDEHKSPYGQGEAGLAQALAVVESTLDGPGGALIGGVLLEPIQGRSGARTPLPGFLAGLRRICDERGLLLIADEVFTGFGRTGTLFACDHEGVVPDLLCLGKAMTGGMPLSACVGSPAVMGAFGRSSGEALHTQTFLGHPLGLAASLAAIGVITRERLWERAARLGAWLEEQLKALRARHACVGALRGRGLMWGIELVDAHGQPAVGQGALLMRAALGRGLIVLPEGDRGHILGLNPPLVIEQSQLQRALEVLDDLLPTSAFPSAA